MAYRDPLGAMSPDGTWLATTSGLHLRVQRVAGGPVRELGSDKTQSSWSPSGDRIAFTIFHYGAHFWLFEP